MRTRQGGSEDKARRQRRQKQRERKGQEEGMVRIVRERCDSKTERSGMEMVRTKSDTGAGYEEGMVKTAVCFDQSKYLYT